jgi:two-component system phosphate regulon sensor histidine kinase PhoR
VPDIRLKAALFICALSAICLFLWLISGKTVALVTFSIGLLVYIISHIAWLHRLHVWFKTPVLKDIPEGSGVWEDVFTALLQYERNNITNQTQLSSALERFTLTANAIPDGLVILGASNEIEWCTPHAENQLGLALSMDKNLPIVNLIRDSHFIAYLYSDDYSEPF